MQAAADSSAQNIITNLNNVVGVFNPFITSNELYTGFYTKGQTNTLLNAKQDTLTASTVLLGNGGSITAINWNNITTNKPTNFQSDWNTTVINKPSVFPADMSTGLITSNSSSNIFLTQASAVVIYEPKLTAATTLLGVGSSITNINYNTLSNLPVGLISSNSTSNIFLTQANASTTYATITALNTRENVLTFSSPLTRSTNAIGIDLSAYSTIATNNSTYLRLDGSASMTSKLLILTGTQGNPSFLTNNGGGGDRIVFASGVAGSVLPYSIGYSLNNLWMSVPNTATINTYIDGSIKWSVGSTGAILYGNLNASNILEGNQNLSSKYATSASLANYVLKAGDTMSGALTVNGNINITSSGTNSLIFDNAFNSKKIQLNSNAGLGAGNVDLTFYSAGTFTFKNTALSTTLFSIDDSGSLSFNGRLYPGKGLYTDNVLTSTSNIISSNFIEGGVSLSSKYLTSASLATTYLKLDGTNDMTGKLGIINSGLNTPQFGFYGGIGDRLVLWKGDAGAYPYSLGMNGATMWYSVPNGAIHNFYVNGTSTYQINSTGATLTGALNITSTTIDNHLIITNTATNRYASIRFFNGTQNGYIGIGCTQTTGTYQANMFIETANSIIFATGGFNTTNATPRMILNASGNLGINNSAPSSKLCINPNPVHSGVFNFATCPCIITNPTVSSATVLNDPQPVLHLCREGTNAQTYGQRISFYLSRYENNGINSRTRCDIALAENAFQNITVMTLLSNGNVNIPTSLSINGNQIYDYLFNSTGNTHASTGDYNVSSFGCRFILGTTNQPSVTYGSQNSSYTIYMGLGIEYAASQYGCQIAIPRNVGNPTLSVRFKEANNWGGWSAITAGVATALNGTAKFTVDVWHTSSDNQQRLYFGNNSTTYIQGQSTTPIVFRNNANSDIAVIDSNGKMTLKTINISGFDGLTLRIDGANNYWNIFTGTTPTTLKTNSLIFFHGASGIASNWWLDGTQTNTNADISDKRSKYNIEDFTALETIEKLKPKSFDVIDDKDVKFQYGFIAQDIEEIPEVAKLVFTEPDYIANINSYGKRTNDDGCCIITANDDLIDKIAVGDELKFVSDNKDKDNQEFVLDATPYHNRYKRRYAKVTEIISPTQFKVDCEINKFCCLDDDEFLIYGKKVEDAKSLDYNSFIALNTKAIQELYKIIQQQQEQLNELRNLINPKY